MEFLFPVFGLRRTKGFMPLLFCSLVIFIDHRFARMKVMNKVVVIGASVVDVLMKSKEFRVLKSHEVPGGVAMAEVLGGKIEAENCKLCSGGGGSNVAVGLKRLGEAVKIVSRIGDDYMGSLIVKELEENQLDLDLPKGKGETGVSSVN
jgi:sugar/nucleoside kinase (ribokinase family)